MSQLVIITCLVLFLAIVGIEVMSYACIPCRTNLDCGPGRICIKSRPSTTGFCSK